MSDVNDVFQQENDDPTDGQSPNDAVDASVEDLTSEPIESDSTQPATDDVAELKQQISEANDRALRSHAELENFRRRIRREMEDSGRYANQSLLHDLLSVVDNIERAVESAQQNADGAGLLEGVKLVNEQLHSVLEKHHCVKIDAVGEEFDPSLHEAIAQQPSDEIEEGKISLVAVPGFKLHDRVVRAPQVIVSTGPASTD